MGRALLTDLYQLNMAVSYLRRGMTAPATFSLFVRSLPDGWGFFVAAGLEACLDYLESLRFEEDELAYLRETRGYTDEDLEALRGLRFTGEVAAIPEGRRFHPDEPILEVTAPLPEAQLVETYLLNQVTYQTAIASKAVRCRLAAPEARMVDFALRRVHGTEAGMAVARATAIAGFEGTSNVAAARDLGLEAVGTMAHSYIEAFDSETAAFRAYAEDFPGQVVLLVDTYDTLRGVEKAIAVAQEMADRDEAVTAIRLDSGDMGSLAARARRMLDEAGLGSVRILASGGLDEREIADLAGAPIDAFGVGSKIGTAAGASYLDSVYKIVAYDGRPVAKLSTEKETLPGPKQVWRRPEADVIALRDEDDPEAGDPLLVTAMRDGERLDRTGWREARDRLADELEGLPEGLRRLDALAHPVERSPALQALHEEVRDGIERRELGAGPG